MSRRGVILQNSMMAIVRHPLRSFLVTTTFALGLASVVSIVGTIEGVDVRSPTTSMLSAPTWLR
jgi:hypothetical protein